MDGSSKKQEDLLIKIRENREIALDGNREIYEESLKDLKFLYDYEDAQWPDHIEKNIKLTANNLLKFARQIRADARQNRPVLKVVPVDDKADVEMAGIYNDLIRQIEHLSNADSAYDTAYMQSISGSFGYFRIISEFSDPMSFDQSLKIKRIGNQYTVRFDPASKEADRSDAKFCFIDSWMKRNEFEKKYPKATASDFNTENQGTLYEGWFDDEKVLVSEYYYKEEEEMEISKLQWTKPNGMIVNQVVEMNKEGKEFQKKNKAKIIDTRKSIKTVVRWALVTGTEILEETVWPGKYIPVVAVLGDEIIIEGKTMMLSFHRGAHDLQRMLNFWISTATEAVALIPKTPYIVTKEQIQGHEVLWGKAHKENLPYLVYNETSAGKPSRERPMDTPTGALNMVQTMSAGIEDHLGMFDASKGAPSNERSGVAIRTRIGQSQKGSFVFVDNRLKAHVYAAKIIVDAIPKIYDTQRVLRLRGEDGESRNQPVNVASGELDAQDNPVKLFDLSIGEFDLIETVSAATESRRQEEREGILSAMQFAPSISPALIPGYLELLDIPNSEKYIESVKQFMQAQQEGAQDGRQ